MSGRNGAFHIDLPTLVNGAPKHPLYTEGAPQTPCQDLRLDPDLFHPEPSESGNAAKTLCRRCPLLVECLVWALPITNLTGVWGATTTGERVKLRRRGGQRLGAASVGSRPRLSGRTAT